MAAKPKVAICWLNSCAGCDETIVDLNDAILKVAEAADIVFWPVAVDFKYDKIKSMEDNEIALSLIHGSVRNSEQEEVAELLRAKSQLVIAFGACACFGGTPGLANFITKEEIFDWVYRDAPTVVNPKDNRPQPLTEINGKKLTLPEFYDHVYTLNQVIDVDYFLPGCPPPPDLVLNAVNAVLSGDLPPRGSTLAARTALCDSCPRNRSKPDRLEIRQVRRIHQVEADPDVCFLAQGLLCLGPATRAGCGETCIRINMPCRGCFGPVPGVLDAGAKAVSAFACLLKAGESGDPRRLMESIDDPAGFVYRFSQPSSILGQRRRVGND